MDGHRDTEPIADATGIDEHDDAPAMPAAKDLTDDDAGAGAGGDERTAIEGLSGIGATNRAFGGGALNAAGGIGTHVPAEGDEHAPDLDDPDDRDRPAGPRDSTDPRGY
jgi:hypothetical protein